MGGFLHTIILQKPSVGTEKRILEAYPTAFKVNEQTFLVRTDKVSSQIREAIGIGEPEGGETVLGVVFKLNGTYSGCADTSLWEWLKIEE